MGYERIKCPYCGFEGEPREYTLMYEGVVYVVDHEVEGERRERPPLLICPRCGQGFWLRSPYERFFTRPQRASQRRL